MDILTTLNTIDLSLVYIGVGSRDWFIDEAHTVLDIFPACCLVRFAAFLMTVFGSSVTNQQTLAGLWALFG